MAAVYVQGVSRAAKLVATGEIKYDTARMERRTEEAVIEQTQQAVAGMNYLQISRDRGTVSLSLQYAVSHLRNALDVPELVSTPAPDDINFFYHRTMPLFTMATDYLEPQIHEDDNDDSKHVFVHPCFLQFREREVSIWLVRIGPYTWDGPADDLRAHWVVIIAATRPLDQPIYVPAGQAVDGVPDVDNDRDRFYDRVVVDVQVFDPLAYEEAKRRIQRRRALTYFNILCRRAAVLLRPATLRREPEYPKGYATWQTGFLCYGIVKEYLRRLNIASRAGFGVDDIGGDDEEDDDLEAGEQPDRGVSGAEFWERVMRADYDCLEHIDACRESMMAGCAVRAIQMSEYRARVGIELPGMSTGHKPERLDRVKGPNVTVPLPFDGEPVTGGLMMGIWSSNAA